MRLSFKPPFKNANITCSINLVILFLFIGIKMSRFVFRQLFLLAKKKISFPVVNKGVFHEVGALINQLFFQYTKMTREIKSLQRTGNRYCQQNKIENHKLKNKSMVM